MPAENAVTTAAQLMLAKTRKKKISFSKLAALDNEVAEGVRRMQSTPEIGQEDGDDEDMEELHEEKKDTGVEEDANAKSGESVGQDENDGQT